MQFLSLNPVVSAVEIELVTSFQSDLQQYCRSIFWISSDINTHYSIEQSRRAP